MRQQNKIISTLVSLILVSTTLEARSDTWWAWGPRTTVMFTNEVGGGRQLTMHCRRSDEMEDFGVHVLNPHDSYRFKLSPRLSTAFYCSMDWGVGGPSWFDIYYYERDGRRCPLHTWCTWIIKETGSCMSHAGAQYCYQWLNN